MFPTIRTQLETPSTSESLYEPVCRLFAAVFGAPPLNRSPQTLASQRRSLRSLMTERTFGLATAWDDEQLVGFAYGHALTADSHWWDGLLEPVEAEITREWDGRTFAVIDMGVAQSHQAEGVGRQLLHALLAGRPEERASLSVVPDNDRAHGFYRHLGWRYVGRVQGAPEHTSPFFDMYVRDLD